MVMCILFPPLYFFFCGHIIISMVFIIINIFIINKYHHFCLQSSPKFKFDHFPLTSPYVFLIVPVILLAILEFRSKWCSENDF